MNGEHFIPHSPQPAAAGAADLVIALVGESVVLRAAGGGFALPAGADFPGVTEVMRIGRIGEAWCGALIGPEAPEVAGLEYVELRRALPLLSPVERIALARGRMLLHSHQRRRHCGICGKLMAPGREDAARVCTACGAAFFPEIAPAVIVAVRRGDRLLLAHNRKFRPQLFSLVAGFVEPGESLEEAVAREVREEVNLELREIRYFGSQSWPFPNSLMVGFTAEYAGGELTPDGEEITEAGFFKVEEFPEIPTPGSISRALIDDFVQKNKK